MLWNGVIAQLIRALPLQGRGPGFESLLLHQHKTPCFGMEFYAGTGKFNGSSSVADILRQLLGRYVHWAPIAIVILA